MDFSTILLYSPFGKLKTLKLVRLKDFKGLVKGGVQRTPPGSFSHLRVLEIQSCGEMLKKLFMPTTARKNFQYLERLRISRCNGLEEVIGASEEFRDVVADLNSQAGADAIGQAGAEAVESHFHHYLPSLKILSLVNLPELNSICSHLGTLSSDDVETIEIISCPKLQRLPLSLPFIW